MEETITAADSPAVAFLQMMWSHAQEATGHSWLKLNHAMADVLSLAIRGGMQFREDDFKIISKRFRSGYWVRDSEWIYNLAVLYRNSSAYRALEKYFGRKPFIVKGASIRTHTGDGPCGDGLARLIVGAEFTWNGERVKVSSFNDRTATFTACSYSHTRGEKCPKCPRCYSCGKSGETKILHRYKISHADLREAKRAAKGASA